MMSSIHFGFSNVSEMVDFVSVSGHLGFLWHLVHEDDDADVFQVFEYSILKVL